MTATQTHNGGKRAGIWLASGAGVVIILVGTLAVAGGWFEGDTSNADRPTTVKVSKEDFIVGVAQTGQIQARNREVIRSQVRRTVQLTMLIDEGTQVEPGDILAEFNSTEIEERLTEQEQQLQAARSSHVASEVNLKNTISQSASNIDRAELNYEFAVIDLKKYLEGEYPQELKRALADVEIARENYTRAADKAQWSKMLSENGYITESEAAADIASANKSKLDLEVAEGRLALLQDFTFDQTKRRLESNVKQTRDELERVKNRAQADIERANVELSTSEANLTRRERDVERERENLQNCKVYAPVRGRVVFAPQGRRGTGDPLAVGMDIRYDQELFHLPESGAMSVEIKIDETQRDKIAVGMPVHITGPNIPEAGMYGKLHRIAVYLDPSGWWNNNMKVYSAVVHINDDEPLGILRTGMNCKTEIIVAQYSDALTLPLQCVTMVDDQHVVYVPGQSGPVKVPVTIGLDNGRRVRILDGLEEGMDVISEPPLAPSAKRQRIVEPPQPEEEMDGTPNGGEPSVTPDPSGQRQGQPNGESRPAGERRRPGGAGGRGTRPDGSGTGTPAATTTTPAESGG